MSAISATSESLAKRPPIVRGMRPDVPPVVGREMASSHKRLGAAPQEGHITTVSFIVAGVIALIFDSLSFFGSLFSIAIAGFSAHPFSSVLEQVAGVNVGASLSAAVVIFLALINIPAALGYFIWFASKGLGSEGGMWAGSSIFFEFVPFLQAIPQNFIMVFVMYRRHRATLLEETLSVAGVAATVGTGGAGAAISKAGAAGAARGAASKEAGRVAERSVLNETPNIVAGPSRIRAYTQRTKDYAAENLSSEALKRKMKEEVIEKGTQYGIDAVERLSRPEEVSAEHQPDEYSDEWRNAA